VAVALKPITANPNTKVVEAKSKSDTQPAATQKAAPEGMSHEELLEYMDTLPNANPKMRKLLEDLVAQKKATTQPAGEKKPVYTYQQLLDYLNTLPNANPLMRKTLEDLIAKEKQEKKGKPQPETKKNSEKETIYRLMLSQRNGKTYACREDNDLIYELDNKVFEDATAEMHLHKIATFEVDEVRDLAFNTSVADIAFHKTGKKWTYVIDPHLPIDDNKITEVLNVFRDFSTHRFVDYDVKDVAKYKLDQNVDKVTITTNGARKIEILLSKVGPKGDPDKSKYAMLADTKKVFLLKGDQVDKFAQKLEDFEESEEH